MGDCEIPLEPSNNEGPFWEGRHMLGGDSLIIIPATDWELPHSPVDSTLAPLVHAPTTCLLAEESMQYAFGRSQTLNFDLFLGQQHTVWHSLVMLGSSSVPVLPVSRIITGASNRHTCNNAVSMQSLYFSLSVQYSVNYMKDSTLYDKISFLLADFTHL